MIEIIENPEYTFRTMTGTCIVTPEQIILTRKGIRGRMAKTVFGDSMKRALIISGLIAITFTVTGIWFWTNANYVMGSILGILGLTFILNTISSRNNSAAPVIERSTIRHIKVYVPHPPLTRGGFAVYLNEQGKQKKRLILLPGSFQGGGKEYLKAVKIMQEVGLLDED